MTLSIERLIPIKPFQVDHISFYIVLILKLRLKQFYLVNLIQMAPDTVQIRTKKRLTAFSYKDSIFITS